MLEKSKLGCHIGHIYSGALGYADDIVLLAPQVSTLQKMLCICCNFAEQNSMIFNKVKSKVMIFSKEKCCSVPEMFLNSNEDGEIAKNKLEVVDNFVHLGHSLKHNLEDDEDIQKCVFKFNRKSNCVISDFKKLYTDQRFQMLVSYCTSFYGSQLWCKKLSCLNNLYVSYRFAVKKTLRIPRRSHNIFIPMLTGMLPIEQQIHKRVLAFFYKCIHSQNNCVRTICRMIFTSPVSYYGNYVRELSYKYRVNYATFFQPNQISRIKSALYLYNQTERDQRNDSELYANMIIELIEMRENYSDYLLDYNEITFVIDYLCTF